MADIDGLLAKYKEIADERFFDDVFVRKEYEEILRFPADVVLDVGALAGEFSAYIYPKAKTIYALEPFSSYFSELEENVKEFELEKIKPIKVALGAEDGTGWISGGKDRGGNRLVTPEDGAEEVEVKTLNTFMKEQGIEHINILKTDIENGELDMFTAEGTEEALKKVDVIIGEHLGNLDQLLKGYGFKKIDGAYNVIYSRLEENDQAM